ncbi:MAG: LPS-assembly protein LptD [Rikenellaceae bacterium]|nr:LPS-assembly protein LptD [Rikenellaceae bacterium]
MAVKFRKYGALSVILIMVLFVQWTVFADIRPDTGGIVDEDLNNDAPITVPDSTEAIVVEPSLLLMPDSIVPSSVPFDTSSADSLMIEQNRGIIDPALIDSLRLKYDLPDSLRLNNIDSLTLDSLLSGSLILDSLTLERITSEFMVADTIGPKSFLDDPITGKTDSLVYRAKEKMIYAYDNGEVYYQDMTLIADYTEFDLETKFIFAYGVPDTTGVATRPIFQQSGSEDIIMDTIVYNLDTHKAKIKNIFTRDGDGILRGGIVKRMPDKTINIAGGQYTTCDHDHPHFYFQMTKAKVIPGKKIVMNPTYFVMEDVPIYFLGLPFGFVPLNNNQSSGFIMPTFGEQSLKGFFLRDGGYYWCPNDYMDMTLLGGIYTLGSWETSLSSRYMLRYKFRGNLNLNFAKEVFGDRGSLDFGNMTNFRVQWTHTQDPKFRPNSTFAASVNFSTSGYNQYSSNNINDYVNTQTNSSISYSKNWPNKPFSFSTNMSHSQNNRDSTITIAFPNYTFSVSRIYPFKRQNRVGKEKLYEKINLTYTNTFTNKFTVKEKDLFTDQTLKNMKNGMNHSIPISATMNLFNYINVTSQFNYTERWYFDKIHKEWNPDTNTVDITDTIRGFYRVYNYNYSASMTTNVYGTFMFGSNSTVQAIRHVMTPTVSFAYTPDFGQAKFGYWEQIQQDSTGRMGYYSPYENGINGVPGRSRSATMSFSLKNTLEMKVRYGRDSTGTRKVKILDELSFRGNYNFLADSLNLSTISVVVRSTLIKDFNINLNMVFDPYQVDKQTGRRINKFLVQKGKLARLQSVGTSFSYRFNGGATSAQGYNSINGVDGYVPGQDIFDVGDYDDEEYQFREQINMQRRLMTGLYYDFSVPYNLGVNYSVSYYNNGVRKTVTQTMSFNASVNLTSKWAITYNGGYDLQAKKLTTGVFYLTRDLHCWQMNFSWVPIGFLKSWSFNISVKSGVLRDVKYDKRSSYYDNYYDK